MRKVLNRINQEKARDLLQKGFLKWKKVPDKIELINLPFYLFKVVVDPGNDSPKHEFVLVDALTGVFSFFDPIPIEMSAKSDSEFYSMATIEEAKGIVNREYTFHLLHRNLRTKLPAKLSQIAFENRILYPFWIGYYIHSNHYSLEIIDGLNGKKQIGSMKQAVVNYLEREFKSTNEHPRKPQDIVHSLNK